MGLWMTMVTGCCSWSLLDASLLTGIHRPVTVGAPQRAVAVHPAMPTTAVIARCRPLPLCGALWLP